MVLALTPSTASSAGGPFFLYDSGVGGPGAVSPDGQLRFAALSAGGNTNILAIATDGGEIRNERFIRGSFGIPIVALDESTAGPSADGSRLVLITPRGYGFRERTTLRVFDTSEDRLRPDPIRPRITLEGDFSFDAISPDGDTIYLVEYLDHRDPTEYQVRALDIATAELNPEPILDPAEEPGEMRGYPMTRATSPDGEWEYTLYDGGGDEPFIHALDVARGRTVCIDLPQLDPGDAYRAQLAIDPDGETISVTTEATRRESAATVALVDTSAHEAITPPTPDGAASELGDAASDGAAGDDGPPLWVFAAVALAGVLLVGGAWLLLRGQRSGGLPADPFSLGAQEEDVDAAHEPKAEPSREPDRAPVP